MDARVDAAALAEAAAAVAAVADPKAVQPILTHVLVTAGEGRLELLATDLVLQLAVAVEAVVTRPGQALLPAVELRDVARALAGEVTLSETPNGRVRLTAGRRRVELPTLSAADFPPPRPLAAPDAMLPAATVAALLSRVRHAQATARDRPHHAGTRLRVAGGRADAVATNGHMAAWATAEAPPDAALDVFLPARAAAAVVKLLGPKPAGDVAIGGDDAAITVRHGGAVFVATGVGGGITADHVLSTFGRGELVARAARADLVAALAATDPVAGEVRAKTRAARFTLGEGELQIDADSTRGAAFDAVAVEAPPAAAWRGGLDVDYVREAVAAAPDERLELVFGGSDVDPVELRAEGFRAVVMPVRI